MNDRPFEALITRLSALDALHNLYQQAEAEIEHHIGRPICMPNCGKCCQHNVVMAWGVEVDGLASFLLGQGRLLENVLNRCEAWLTENNRRIYSPGQLLKDRDRLTTEAQFMITGRCPLLDEESKCLIHPMRPLSCRAYGVTTYPRGCGRPYGNGESESRRATNSGMAVIIKEKFTALLKMCKDDSFSVSVGFLPTLLISKFRPFRFTSLADSGHVNPIKLVKNYVSSPAVLTEDQFSSFELAGQDALDECEKAGIPIEKPLVHIIK